MSTSSADNLGAPPLAGVSDTWLEHWPASLAALSFEQQGIRLAWDEVHALGRLNGVHAHCFWNVDASVLQGLRARLDKAVSRFPQGAFIRLGSRSPKDTMLSLLRRNRAQDGEQALSLLSAGSERLSFDLRRCLRAGYCPWVFVREWRDISPEAEFRCFLRQGQWVGASQYHHRSYFEGLDAPESLLVLRRKMVVLLPMLASRSHVRSAVFDVCIEAKAESLGTLIEVNPEGAPTDPCLFSWEQQDFDETLRVRTATGGLARMHLGT